MTKATTDHIQFLRTILDLLLKTGLRLCDVVRITIADVRHAAVTGVLPVMHTRSGRGPRYVPIDRSSFQDILRRLDEERNRVPDYLSDQNSFVFTSAHGRPIAPVRIVSVSEQKFLSHQFRKSLAVSYIEAQNGGGTSET